MKIVILYNKEDTSVLDAGMRAAEEDTLWAAELAKKTIESPHTDVTLFPVTPSTCNRISSIKADCILNYIEYTSHDLQYAAGVFLELRKLGIPYTGCSWDTYYLTTNKIAMKTAFDAYRIPTPAWQFLARGDEKKHKELPFPLIVKPAYEHSGIGVTKTAIVKNATELKAESVRQIRKHNQPVVAEEFINGEELQVTLIDTENGVKMLPIAEYVYPKNIKTKILTYDSRWNYKEQTDVRFTVQKTELPNSVIRDIEKICIRAYKDLGFYGYGRFDLRVRKSTPYIIETNSNPGLDDDPENGLALAYFAAGMTYAEFLTHIISYTLKHPRKP